MKPVLPALVLGAIGLLPVGVLAQSFPDGAKPMASDELRQRVAGRKYSVKLVSGQEWRVEYRADGGFVFDAGGGFTDVGTWTAEDGRLCTQGSRIGSACNDVRLKDDVVYMKRANGEVIRFQPL